MPLRINPGGRRFYELTPEETIEAPKIIVNGERLPYQEEQSLHELLLSLGIDPNRQGVAVAVNIEVVPRAEWKNTILKPHDRVEIIKAVAGG